MSQLPDPDPRLVAALQGRVSLTSEVAKALADQSNIPIDSTIVLAANALISDFMGTHTRPPDLRPSIN